MDSDKVLLDLADGVQKMGGCAVVGSVLTDGGGRDMQQRGVGDFSVVFIGSPPASQEHFLENLQFRIARSPIRDRVIVQGFASDVWPVYEALDIVCVPSTEPEPFGLVAVEAMAMMKPVVASNFGGLTEIVVDGITGIAFKPGDPHMLARAIEMLLRDDDPRQRMGNAGRKRFEAEFSLGRMLNRFASTWSEMMGQTQ